MVALDVHDMSHLSQARRLVIMFRQSQLRRSALVVALDKACIGANDC
jgi:hypothetical protein